MNGDIVIRAERLGKKYVIGHQAERERYTALRDVVARNARALGRNVRDLVRGRPNVAGDKIEEFWALKDINFDVRRGEVVGIVGRNGAGKSTLLKILSRITEPTTGRVEIRGRVASLLEVGTGFHPELTGRENIYLNGAILGMSQREIRAKFDEIVAFAEVERFLHTPVKRYSSGMYVRLAFAVAAHLGPQILVVDEVLAVGDAAFQKKCLGKMGQVAEQGRTVLFVSHNLSAIRALCQKGLLLNGGRLETHGSIDDVAITYLSHETDETRFVRKNAAASLLYLESGEATYIPMTEDNGAKIALCLSIMARSPSNGSVDVRIKDVFGGPVAFSTVGGFNLAQIIEFKDGRNQLKLLIDASTVAQGRYSISVDIANPTVLYHDRIENCFILSIDPVAIEKGTRVLEQQWGFGSINLPSYASRVDPSSWKMQTSRPTIDASEGNGA